eukprot:5010272-Pyramimonas_sp.AAC.1
MKKATLKFNGKPAPTLKKQAVLRRRSTKEDKTKVTSKLAPVSSARLMTESKMLRTRRRRIWITSSTASTSWR